MNIDGSNDKASRSNDNPTTPILTDQQVTSTRTADLIAESGIRRIHMLAWRDLADVEAGGSETHASMVAGCWADAGIEVVMRTSFAQGSTPETIRDGYRVIRRAGRYLIFPRAVLAELTGRHGHRDALVDIWNGVPFFSPLWASRPRMAWIHHIHEHLWPLVLPPLRARAGQILERRLAPMIYSRTPLVTTSHSSRRHLLERMKLPARNVYVVEPGVGTEFYPLDARSLKPTVLSVGRLMPSKAVDVLISAVAKLRTTVPGIRLKIVGEGYHRQAIEKLIRDLGMQTGVDLLGRVSQQELVQQYRSAWVVASASRFEGWGMTLTEAAACATPVVASRIAGHKDAVVDGVTGLLVDNDDDFAPALASLLNDPVRRANLGTAAAARARKMTWERAAHQMLVVLASSAPTGWTAPKGSGQLFVSSQSIAPTSDTTSTASTSTKPTPDTTATAPTSTKPTPDTTPITLTPDTTPTKPTPDTTSTAPTPDTTPTKPTPDTTPITPTPDTTSTAPTPDTTPIAPKSDTTLTAPAQSEA